MSYRFRRRSFLAGLGGAFGLELMLKNLEASAAGTPSPPRFLLTHWPTGTLRTQFVPTGTGTSYVSSPLVQPFEDAGLRADTIVLYGFNHSGLTGMGSGPEGGVVFSTTGASSPGTRDNGGEQDDAVAGGPSWDQIFLKNVPGLARRDVNGTIIGPGFANAICDSRVGSFETSAQCLSYGYETRSITSARPGGQITENVPLMPELSPARLYARLFAGFMPGANQDAALRALRMRKSVLDSALRELDQLSRLAPASERPKIDVHAHAIRQLEAELQLQIDGHDPGSCSVPLAPPESLIGKTGPQSHHILDPIATEGDDETHEAVGRAHFGIIRAAFQCDLIRVATFQWAPATGDVALTGLNPAEPTVPYHYYSMRFRQGTDSYYTSPRPATDPLTWDVMNGMYLWYNRRMAQLVASFKSATDVFGASLLSRTVIPYFTELGTPTGTRQGLAAMVFGGSALGMQGGQFQQVASRPHNDMWMSIGQAYLGAGVLQSLASEVFNKTNVAPVPGLWVAPT
jgi:Protein of unknown function (DUF1552)